MHLCCPLLKGCSKKTSSLMFKQSISWLQFMLAESLASPLLKKSKKKTCMGRGCLHFSLFVLIRLSGQFHFLGWSLSSSRALRLIVIDTLHKSEGHMCWHRPPSVPFVRCKQSCRWAEVCFECSSQINPSFDEDDTRTDLSCWLDLKPGREMP